MVDPGGSPLGLLKVMGWKPGNIDALITSWLNDIILIPLGAELPGAYMDFLNSNLPGLIIDRGVFGFLVISVVLISAGIVRWILPLLYLVSYLTAVRIWGSLPYGGHLFGGDMLFALLSGSTLIGAFVFIGNPATGTKTRVGTAVLAVFAGFLAFWFRFRGGDAYGLISSIAIVNVLAILARSIEHRTLFTRGRKK
jgi:electron transport complex protein RnfD